METKSKEITLPIVLIPIYFTTKNFIQKESLKLDSICRILGCLIVGLCIMYTIYEGGFEFLIAMQSQINLIFIHPRLILNILFFTLFVMLFFTNFFAALSQIYTAKDLEMIHSSPISPFSFFAGNLLKTYILTTWMSFIFIIPIFAFLTEFHNSSFLIFLLSGLVCLVYFSITTSTAYILASIYPIILPNKMAKTFIKILLFGLALIFINTLLLIGYQSKGIQSIGANELMNFAPVVTTLRNPYLPSYWAARIIGDLLIPSSKIVPQYVVALFSLAMLSFSLAYLSLRKFYSKSLLIITSSSEKTFSSSRVREYSIRKFLPCANPVLRAMMIKDLRTFSRNVGQVGQMIMLLSMTVSYMYIINYQVDFISGRNETDRLWWINALTICNSCIEAFITLAFGTRIIYPQWSLEGKAIWLLQSSPIDFKDIFRTKLATWLIPSSIFLSVLFTLTLVALKASISMLIIKFFSTMITTYGLVGLGLGMGAYFTDLQKEDTSETTASFGSLLFMLLGFVLIFTNLLLLSFVYSNSLGSILGFDSTQEIKLGLTSLISAVIFFILNISIAHLALLLGMKRIAKSVSN